MSRRPTGHDDGSWSKGSYKDFDESQKGKSRLRVMPRRGPEKLSFPMPADKAIKILTGQPTLSKAIAAFRSFTAADGPGQAMKREGFAHFNAHLDMSVKYHMAQQWSKVRFWQIWALYSKTPRRGFNRASWLKKFEKNLKKIS